MSNRRHVQLRDEIIGQLRQSGLDVAPAPDGAGTHVSGLLGVSMRVSASAERPTTPRAEPGRVAVLMTHRRGGGIEVIMRAESLIELLNAYCPASDAGRPLSPAPPPPAHIASGNCIQCAAPIIGKKPSALYCSARCSDRNSHVRRVARLKAGVTG